jgi:hypothetical protein
MGSTFHQDQDQLLTIEEAAARLQRSRRSIFEYLKKGFLTRRMRDGKLFVSRREVEELAVELCVDLPALTRKNLFRLESRLRQVEEKMAVYETIWNAQGELLRPKPAEAAALYRAATDYLCAKEWEIAQLESWADIFNRVGEETLQAIAEAVHTTKPWECFYQLAARMLAFIESVPASREVLALKALHDKMEEGRKKVRAAALLWIEMGRGTVQQDVFREMDTPGDDLLRRLAQKKSNPT